MKRNGFTLIELMVVLAICGILAAIVVPNYQKRITRYPQREGQNMAKKFAYPKYATVSWTVQDVKTLKPHWSLEHCDAWLGMNQKRLQEAMISHGWEVMEMLLPKGGKKG